MFKTILVPTDGSPLSDKAIEAAARFAKTSGGKLIGLSVAEPHYAPQLAEGSTVIDTEYYAQKMKEIAQANVEKVEHAARQAGVPCETTVRTSVNPYEEIIAAAKEYGCDVIFMASHGRKGLSALFVGSETHKVLAYSTVPVLVFR
ncbi:MAG TPA: universal stress protein [Noviherbaspirillum sp.]